MDSRSVETPAQLRALVADLRRQSLPFRVAVQPAPQGADGASFGRRDLDDFLSRRREIQSGRIPDLASRQYVNEDD